MVGSSVYRNLNVNATGVNIKASPGKIVGFILSNVNAVTAAYVKLYDKATAPTVGTDTPKMTILVPLVGSVVLPLSDVGEGIDFANGIGIGATTGAADADTTAPTANNVIANILYR
jgi:hypothetical protein